MLVQLSISNFAIIKHIEIGFEPGLNIMSGETGAGKSIIINAMNLILGGRASTDLIRSKCSQAKVEALFNFPERGEMKKALDSLGIPFDGDLVIRRTIYREGRNKIFINGSIATLQILSRLGGLLISISGQHEHQSLLKPDNHLALLDDFSGLGEEKAKLAGLVGRYESIRGEISVVSKRIREIRERQELTTFQMDEIEKANIVTGEDELLIKEKKRLQHAEELFEIVSEGYQDLYEKGNSVLSSLSQCIKRIEKGVNMDARLGPIRETALDIQAKLEDSAFFLRDFQAQIMADPSRLEEVEERIHILNMLKRKYGPALEDVIEFGNRLSSTVEDLESKREKLRELEGKRDGVASDMMAKATRLSKKRKAAAVLLEKDVEKELAKLGMAETRFQVRFFEDGGSLPQEKKAEMLRADGFDAVEFMISPNVGEELRSLSKTASGGELSRFMLAMKTILARTASIETVIFDEVDSGIGGATAEVVGEKLMSLSRYHQILCITHLPQIACKGPTHLLVQKEIIDGRTEAHISELDSRRRVREIARLLGGKEVTARALAHAKEMLD